MRRSANAQLAVCMQDARLARILIMSTVLYAESGALWPGKVYAKPIGGNNVSTCNSVLCGPCGDFILYTQQPQNPKQAIPEGCAPRAAAWRRGAAGRRARARSAQSCGGLRVPPAAPARAPPAPGLPRSGRRAARRSLYRQLCNNPWSPPEDTHLLSWVSGQTA